MISRRSKWKVLRTTMMEEIFLARMATELDVLRRSTMMNESVVSTMIRLKMT